MWLVLDSDRETPLFALRTVYHFPSVGGNHENSRMRSVCDILSSVDTALCEGSADLSVVLEGRSNRDGFLDLSSNVRESYYQPMNVHGVEQA